MGILDMLTSVMAARAAKELDPAVIPVILSEVLGSGGEGGLRPSWPDWSRLDLAIRSDPGSAQVRTCRLARFSFRRYWEAMW